MASIINYADYIHFSFVIYCPLLASYRRFDLDPKWLKGFIRYFLYFRESLLYKPTLFFYYSRRICIFPKGLTHDSGQKFQMTLSSLLFCIRDLMMLFSQKEAFLTT